MIQNGPGELIPRPGEYLRTRLRDGHGVLEVRGKAPVLGDRGPAVLERPDPGQAGVHHRLDGQHQAGPQPGAGAGLAEVGHLGRLVELAPDAVPDELPDHREPRRLGAAPARRPRCPRPGPPAGPRRPRRRAPPGWPPPAARPPGSPCPTRTVSAASPWNPPRMAPKSSPTRSPSRRTRLSEGMPWTTSSFTEMQTLAG